MSMASPSIKPKVNISLLKRGLFQGGDGRLLYASGGILVSMVIHLFSMVKCENPGYTIIA